MDPVNPGMLIGIGIMVFGIILSIGKFQYEHDLKSKNKSI